MKKVETNRNILPVYIVFLVLCLFGFGWLVTVNYAAPEKDLSSGSLLSASSDISPPTALGPLPYDMASNATLKASGKKVFAHYFSPYPISIDNKSPDSDYYALGYLTPNGESGKHASYGGFLRERPLTRPINGASDWRLTDMKTEVSRATNAGIDGFTYDILSLSGTHWDRLNTLLQAASEIDPSFKLVLMPDSNSGAASDANTLADAMTSLVNGPYGSSIFRLSDNRVVISPFYAETKGLAFWQAFLARMQSNGVPVAFVPCFLNYGANADAYSSISYGFSNWGNRSPAQNQNLANTINDAHSRGKIWMQPVSLQDARPSGGVYDEANNTENLRLTWSAAITGGADWVQIPTWNDYSENTEISPSTHIGWSPLDINGYYLHRFKQGSYPTIKRDVLYLSHRVQAVGAPITGGQTLFMTLRGNSSPARDGVEVLSFLSAAASITVQTGTTTQTYNAPAGVFSKVVSLNTGTVAATVNYPNGSKRTITSPFAVLGSRDVQDLSYYFSSSGRSGVDTNGAVPVEPSPSAGSSSPSSVTGASNDNATSETSSSQGDAKIKAPAGEDIQLSDKSGTQQPIIVSGGTKITVPETNVEGDDLVVTLDGKVVESNQIDTANLTNGVHIVVITNKKTGDVTRQEIIVDNPPLRAAINLARANPVASSGIVLGLALTLLLLVRFQFHRYMPLKMWHRITGHLSVPDPTTPSQSALNSIETTGDHKDQKPGTVIEPKQ